MKSLLVAVAVSVAGLLLVAATAAPPAKSKSEKAAPGPPVTVVFYVSPQGKDSWSGALLEPNAAGTDGPFATPQRARDVIRKHRADGIIKCRATIQIRAGTYYLDEPLALAPEDSGTTDAPLVIEPYPGEKPVLSGGRRITGFTKDAAGRWTATIPEVKEGKWSFRQIFVGGERRPMTRLPKEGFFTVVSQPGVDWKKDKYNTPGDKFEFAPGDIKAAWAGKDVEVVLLHFWVDTHLKIAGVDDEKHVATFDRKARRKFTDDYTQGGARYYVLNAPDALDTPGQWHLDRSSGVLVYLPKPGEDPAKTEVIAPRLAQVVRFEGDPAAGKFVENVWLRNLTISHTAWDLPPNSAGDGQAAQDVPGAVLATGLRHASIERCRIENIGTYGIDLQDGCQEVRVAGNEIAHTGAGGIKVNGAGPGSPEARRTCRNQITDNHIYDGGQIWHSGLGILVRHSGENLVAHNHIHHLYYTGISVGWTWGYAETVSKANIIEYNYIHDIGMGLLSDMGGIYTLGQSQGTIIRYNLIHDILSHGYGGWGIYTDEGSTGILIENNVVYRTKTGGFHQHYGKENIIHNNIFAFAKVGQVQRTRAEP
ncbi:MAG: right-handed parallel beta-helix repeat-containing protein, partial [Planctomycetota bacterium]|nr:right-handed parallel beta-helix repeat-containing protein [Planctomycetota bacterium]